MLSDAEERVAAGLPICGDPRRCLPARLTRDETAPDGLALATLELSEGRHHQVKRMIAALGGHVERLHRDRIGALDLPTDLAVGAMRSLRPDERARLCE